jgi:hypothetical protein
MWKAKKATCKVCGEKFEKHNSIQPTCDKFECKLSYAMKAAEKSRLARERQERVKAKAEAKEFRERKEAAKPLRKLLAEAEKAVNAYVRVRDRFLGCCSCDKPSHWDGQWHASHFKSVGSNSALRFNLWNINKSCSECNLFMSGNIAEYRKRLILKIGADRVEWLGQQNQTRKYEPEYLVRLKRVFTKKTKRLEKRYSL